MGPGSFPFYLRAHVTGATAIKLIIAPDYGAVLSRFSLFAVPRSTKPTFSPLGLGSLFSSLCPHPSTVQHTETNASQEANYVPLGASSYLRIRLFLVGLVVLYGLYIQDHGFFLKPMTATCFTNSGGRPLVNRSANIFFVLIYSSFMV
jgi:hypothetical protein